MAVKTPPPTSTPKLEPGTVWISGLIVAALTAGVAALSASVLAAALVAVGISLALVVILGLLR